ncbi:hypothetical protein [Aliivibrio kagoshimensis]|uniref:hypothetical protein n=1 Tax=Aliivibrio kagoshimensis TaxID=2910230 RepID=UPI003D11644F
MQTLIEQKYLEKMSWMQSHVDVQYPTQESVIGKDYYLATEATETDTYLLDIDILNTLPLPPFSDEIVLIDNHRLTIRFAMLLSEKWPDHKESVFEFLTQIILDESYQLFLAIEQGGPTACALVANVTNETVMISDLAFANNMKTINKQSFIVKLCQRLQLESDLNCAAVVTSSASENWLASLKN